MGRKTGRAPQAEGTAHMHQIHNMFHEAFAPSMFTKGVLQYRQGNYEEARTLIVKAGKWLPEFVEDSFYKAALLLVDSHLGKSFPRSEYEDALESLVDSPYVETVDYFIIVDALKEMLENSC